jgi:hypothetical protein
MPTDRRVSTDRFYGGTTNRLANLRGLLRFVDATQPTSDEIVDWVSANTGGGSESFVERNLDFLATCDVFDRNGSQVTVGSAGAAYLDSRDPLDLFEGFQRGVVGFDAILETLADRPLDDDEIGAYSRMQLDAIPSPRTLEAATASGYRYSACSRTTAKPGRAGSRPSGERRPMSRMTRAIG